MTNSKITNRLDKHVNKFRIYAFDKKCLPKRAHKTDAGLDLCASARYVLTENETVKVDTGINVEIPKGYAGFIYPRSGLATKYGITLANTIGVIDSDYRGPVICVLKFEPRDYGNMYCIERYDRIAQLVIAPVYLTDYEVAEWPEELDETERGQGGFGSSG